MDDWFQIHSFIVSYLSAFQYAISTEGDGRLKEHYSHYVTSESCKLAEIPNLSGEERVAELNNQAEAVQREFGRFKLLSDMRRRDREEEDRGRLQSLQSTAHKTYDGSRHPYSRERRKKHRK